MTQPPKPTGTSSTTSSAPSPPASTRRSQRNRRQYALPIFDFEETTHAPQGGDALESYLSPDPSSNEQPHAPKPQCAVPASPCINATDRAHRARLRLTSVNQLISQETFCDITPLLLDSPKRKPVAEVIGQGEIPEMQLSEDEEDVGGEFEVIEKRECGVVHNGTVRKWYRGFRH